MAEKESYWRPTACVKQAIKDYYPGRAMRPSVFMPAMRQLQAELIRCHFEAMPEEDRARAVKTIDWLETQERERGNTTCLNM